MWELTVIFKDDYCDDDPRVKSRMFKSWKKAKRMIRKMVERGVKYKLSNGEYIGFPPHKIERFYLRKV